MGFDAHNNGQRLMPEEGELDEAGMPRQVPMLYPDQLTATTHTPLDLHITQPPGENEAQQREVARPWETDIAAFQTSSFLSHIIVDSLKLKKVNYSNADMFFKDILKLNPLRLNPSPIDEDQKVDHMIPSRSATPGNFTELGGVERPVGSFRPTLYSVSSPTRSINSETSKRSGKSKGSTFSIDSGDSGICLLPEDRIKKAGREYKCGLCSKSYPSANLLSQHREEHRDHYCNFCGASQDNKDLLLVSECPILLLCHLISCSNILRPAENL
jgi:hypothetical protein